MAHFLRSKLICFYCNRRTSQKKVPGLEKFQCEYCNAENYLDANGDITDPPVNASSSARYARSAERSSSPVVDTSNDIFCNTCLQNQQIYAQSLAEYYPTPNLSTFEEYEQAEAEYKASLEQRYPLICEYCEPLARKRLKDTSYAAKVDNMRRVMDRTNPELRHLNEAGLWKLWIPFLGGLMWALSWGGQIAWDLIGVMNMHADKHVGPLIQHTTFENLQQFVLKWEMSPRFHDQIGWMARYALLLGLASAWWNPRLKDRMSKKGGRMVGLWDYYVQQLIFLALRGVALHLLTSWRDIEREQARAAHLFLLVFSLVAIIRAHRAIQLDCTPKTVWNESPKSLLSQPPRQPSSHQDTPTAIRRRNNIVPRSSPFPIESLATMPLTSLPRPNLDPLPDYTQPSFLPPEDKMDWAPTLPPSRPYTTLHPPPPPFKAPLSGASAGANPSPNLSMFSNLSPSTATTTTTPPPPQPQIADPKFFYPPAGGSGGGGAATETGLETIFDRAFTISHPPAEVRDRRAAAEALQRQQEAAAQRRAARAAICWRIGMLALLLLVGGGSAYLPEDKDEAMAWRLDGWQGQGRIGRLFLSLPRGEVVAFAMAAAVTMGDILAALSPQRQRGRAGGLEVVVLAVLETVATAVLGGEVMVVVEGFGPLADDGGGRRRHSANVRGQMALAVIGLGQLVLLGRECVRARM